MIEIIRGNSFEWLDKAPSGSVELVYMDPPFMTGRDFGAFKDFSELETYLAWITPFLSQARRILSAEGNLVLHTDWRTSHYLRVLADRFFGYDRLMNEIVWCYNSGGASKKWFSKKHDTLLWYTKSEHYTFNPPREPYATPNVADRPGFHPEGRIMADYWNIPFLSTTAGERTGYPTQKPLALAKRIVEAFTNEGDIVVDPFCGSGTTGEACALLNRSAILVDQSQEAVAVARKRLAHYT